MARRSKHLVVIGASSGGIEALRSLVADLPESVDPPQEILDLEQEAFDGVNAERVSDGKAALAMHEGIRAVARAHSRDMARRGYFSHTNLEGASPFDRLAAAGITYTAAGENIAWNQGYADPAATAVSGWMVTSLLTPRCLAAAPPRAGRSLRPGRSRQPSCSRPG